MFFLIRGWETVTWGESKPPAAFSPQDKHSRLMIMGNHDASSLLEQLNIAQPGLEHKIPCFQRTKRSTTLAAILYTWADFIQSSYKWLFSLVGQGLMLFWYVPWDGRTVDWLVRDRLNGLPQTHSIWLQQQNDGLKMELNIWIKKIRGQLYRKNTLSFLIAYYRLIHVILGRAFGNQFKNSQSPVSFLSYGDTKNVLWRGLIDWVSYLQMVSIPSARG